MINIFESKFLRKSQVNSWFKYNVNGHMAYSVLYTGGTHARGTYLWLTFLMSNI